MRTILDAALLLTGALVVIWSTIKLLGAHPPGLRVAGDPAILDFVVRSKKLMLLVVLEIAIGASVAQYAVASSSGTSSTVSRTYVATVTGVLGAVASLLFIRMMARRTSIRLAVATAITTVFAAWLVWPNWLTTNILGAVLTLMMITVCVGVTLNFQFVAMILGGVFLFDVISVYITGTMLEMTRSTMGTIEAPSARMMPTTLVIPQTLWLDAVRSRFLGWGDVLGPGILIVIAGAFARRRNRISIMYAGFAGYAVGLVLVMLLLVTMGRMQPALVTLYPCVVVSILGAAWRAGLLRELFAFRHQPRG